MPGERKTIDDQQQQHRPNQGPGDFGAGAPAETGPHSAEWSTPPVATADDVILDWVVDNFTSDMVGALNGPDPATNHAPHDIDNAPTPPDDGSPAIDPPDPSDLFD